METRAVVRLIWRVAVRGVAERTNQALLATSFFLACRKGMVTELHKTYHDHHVMLEMRS